MIDRVADALREAADELLLIANDPEAGSWLPGIRVERDVRPGLGSLGGIHSALVHARSAALVVAWDMPFVPAPLLASLRAAGEREGRAMVPESGSRRGVEPLCAYYTQALVAPIERCLDAGDLRVIAFYDDRLVGRLAATEVARFGDPAQLFMNVNTPSELELAEHHAATTDGGDRREEA